MRPLYHVIKTTLCILTISITTSASARDAVLFNSEQEIPFAELLDLLDLGGLGNLLNTTATVSATENGTYGATANATPDGRLS